MKRALLVLVLVLSGCGVQPSDPIGGSQATGALIYLIRANDNTVVPILRPTKHQTSASAALAMLAAFQVERSSGYRSEVPMQAEPMTVNGSTVTVPIDVTSLSTLATLQIVCTAAVPGPVTLVGGGQSRGPLTCPV
ncbi:hypothetical protein DMH04_14945 [Kibdelosporangium aridum]|uniref:Lipoprotein n=1 Tax=Kibdelosporangium aridum TaxID=2030 RepID=A0A428ZD16_KIBAR|nr:hypothetical protein [Kibdelosporangium aridum]RSM85972.1 hypothetical protein DMH04_14945 [Kibdelosporangium aridum]